MSQSVFPLFHHFELKLILKCFIRMCELALFHHFHLQLGNFEMGLGKKEWALIASDPFEHFDSKQN